MVDGGKEIFDVSTNILDNDGGAPPQTDASQMCMMKINKIEVPEEFLSAGYKFES